LRRVVGVLGVARPAVPVLWGFALCRCAEVQLSISDYYDLRTRDVFVGTLFAIGWFLFAYRGYDRTDDVPGNLAGLFALGVALFPQSGAGWGCQPGSLTHPVPPPAFAPGRRRTRQWGRRPHLARSSIKRRGLQ